jgi:hypothetical protein
MSAGFASSKSVARSKYSCVSGASGFLGIAYSSSMSSVGVHTDKTNNSTTMSRNSNILERATVKNFTHCSVVSGVAVGALVRAYT